MNHEYINKVVKVAKILLESPLGLTHLEIAASIGEIQAFNDPTRRRILQNCLVELGLCDRNGNITDLSDFQTFMHQVQGAMWAYTDSRALAPKIQLVITEPNWINQSRIRQTEDVFRDLIQMANHNLWIVNPFFSIDSQHIMSLFSLIASRIQQNNITVRLILRKVAPNRQEYALPVLRRLCTMLPQHYLTQLSAYSLDLNEGVERQTFHAKIIVQDDRTAYIGSANWTDSSLLRVVELGVLIDGSVVQQQIIPVLQTLLRYAEPVLLETIQ